MMLKAQGTNSAQYIGVSLSEDLPFKEDMLFCLLFSIRLYLILQSFNQRSKDITVEKKHQYFKNNE